MSKKPLTGLVAFLLVGIIFIGGYWWLNRGYGEVSPMTYEYSKALYGACLSKSEERLTMVEELLAKDDGESLSTKERDWIDAIVTRARNGKWEAAAQQAKRIMEDQVEY